MSRNSVPIFGLYRGAYYNFGCVYPRYVRYYGILGTTMESILTRVACTILRIFRVAQSNWNVSYAPAKSPSLIIS